MKRKIRVIIIITVLVFVGISVWGTELLQLSVVPLSAWLELGAGGAYSGSFTVTNVSDTTANVNVFLFDFLLGETGEIITLEPETLGERSLSSYITYSPEQMTLQPGESRSVTYSLTLLSETNGPCWATLVVTPDEPEEVPVELPETEGITFIVRLHTQYLFTIIQRPLNPPTPAGQMVEVDVKGAAADDGTRQVTIAATFQNLVDDVRRCKVYFEIRDPEGEMLARYEEPRDLVVFPTAVRVFNHTFEGLEMPPGKYLILGVVDFGGDYLAAGQYLATVSE